jgi:hypothetical protein
VSSASLGQRVIQWALDEQSVNALVQIGSRTRRLGESDLADAYSDWDFQIITPDVSRFDTADWIRSGKLGSVLAYALRDGRLGSSRKLSIVFDDGELDLILIPFAQIGELETMIKRDTLSEHSGAMRALADLSLVLRGGYKILKGESLIAQVYGFAATRVKVPRLSDDHIRQLANGFVCDYVSTLRKIERGELLAAQRWLHHHLAETAFRLLHESRLRKRQTSFPDARRIELIAKPKELQTVTVATMPSRDSLIKAADKSAHACREIVAELIGDSWAWPDLGPLRLSTK